jgi:hypothetical protein
VAINASHEGGEVMRNILGVVVLVLVAGCTDKAEAPLAACQAAETSGDLEHAAKLCEQAANADPSSTAGLAAGSKLAEINGKITAKKRAEADAIAAAEAKEEARCKDWMLVCTPGGASHFPTKTACRKLASDTQGKGVSCGECVCYSSAP